MNIACIHVPVCCIGLLISKWTFPEAELLTQEFLAMVMSLSTTAKEYLRK